MVAVILRCGRLDDHPEHDWASPRLPFAPAHTWHCNGHVVTECAQQEWAAESDLAELLDNEMRERLMGWGA